MDDTALRSITYRFGDASVPPDCHRSYVITVTPDHVRIVVDSYGDVLADKTYAITPAQFDDVKGAMKSRGIGNCAPGGDDDAGGTGGTTESISCSNEKGKVFSGSVYHCAGKDTGDLCGDVAGFAADVKKLVPDLEKLIV